MHGSLAILLIVLVVFIVSVAAGGPSRAGRKRGQTKAKISVEKRNAENKAKRQREANDDFWSRAFGRSDVRADDIQESPYNPGDAAGDELEFGGAAGERDGQEFGGAARAESSSSGVEHGDMQVREPP